MPSPYRGIIRIICKKEVCVEDKVKKNVAPHCLQCVNGAGAVIGLDDKIIYNLKEGPPLTEAKRKTKK